jgi:hypothetical protein
MAIAMVFEVSIPGLPPFVGESIDLVRRNDRIVAPRCNVDTHPSQVPFVVGPAWSARKVNRSNEPLAIATNSQWVRMDDATLHGDGMGKVHRKISHG